MKKQTKRNLLVAASLFVAGCVLFTAVMFLLRWDFTKLATVTFETNTHSVTDAYTHIAVVADTADVTFVLTDDTTTKVVCHEESGIQHMVSVQEDTLTIQAVNQEKWYERIGIQLDSPTITVYMPKGTYGSLTATVTTGDITATNMTFTGDITVTVTTGDIDFANVTCTKLQTKGNTGDVSFVNVVARQAFTVTRTTGDVTLEGCDAQALTIETDTGDVAGSFLSSKVFIPHTDTGDITVPETTVGGTCKITTDTGDIYITPAE